MGRHEKILFTIFVIVTQGLQFLAVYSIAFLNQRAIEFLFIFLSFQFNRAVFGKSYHADKLSKCTLTTLVIFYFLTSGVFSLNVSLFIAPLFGVYLSYLLNQIQELIDNQKVPKTFVKRKLRDQIFNILGERRSEEEVNEYCTQLGLHPKIAETVFLYLSNSKDEVADILEIEGTTVIRRLKKFIEKATKN